jgi:hypothetical protein
LKIYGTETQRQEALEASAEFYDFLEANTGATAEWPVSLMVRGREKGDDRENQALALSLAAKLTRLKSAGWQRFVTNEHFSSIGAGEVSDHADDGGGSDLRSGDGGDDFSGGGV